MAASITTTPPNPLTMTMTKTTTSMMTMMTMMTMMMTMTTTTKTMTTTMTVTIFIGRGSTLNCNGEVEMDALIMEGHRLEAGGVACVRNIAHPIALARLVMDKVGKRSIIE